MDTKKLVNGKYIPLTKAELAELNQQENDWAQPHRLRISVPFALIEQKKDLLIYKLWCEHSGLPVENLGDTYHMYCNEIMADDIEMLKALQPMGVVVEGKDDQANGYLASIGVEANE